MADLHNNYADAANNTIPNATPASMSMSMSVGAPTTDQLERCGKWLVSIPRDDITVLRHTPEFQEFLRAFERLGHAHLRVIVNNNQTTIIAMETETETEKTPPAQSLSPDDTNISNNNHSVKWNEVVSIEKKKESDSSTDNNTIQCDIHSNNNCKCKCKFIESHAAFVNTDNLRNTIVSETDQPQTTIMLQQRQNQEQAAPHNNHAMVAAVVDPNSSYGNKQTISKATTTSNNKNNFLRFFTDDVLLRIFEFLRCRSLIQTSLTCSRFQELAIKSATQRSLDIANTRQLRNVMQLLRAREQIYYIDNNNNNTTDEQQGDDAAGTISDNNNNNKMTGASGSRVDFHVPVPTLLPGRRVLVTNAGDPEYNGVYYCTDCNGNGFVFTKPRFSSQQQQASHRVQGQTLHQLEDTGVFDNDDMNDDDNDNNNNNDPQQNLNGQQHLINNDNDDQFQPQRQQDIPNNTRLSGRFEGESAQSGQPLRCIIGKAYSNHVSIIEGDCRNVCVLRTVSRYSKKSSQQ